MKLQDCSALITGASSGIGREFARRLAPIARTLVLVARRVERLEELRNELLAHNPDLSVHIRPSDISDKTEVYALAESLTREKIHIDLLINNAGLGDLGTFATSEPERIEQIMLVNMVGLTLLTRMLLPSMIANGKGGILNVSSSAGFLPIAGFAVYAASKAYLTSFSEGLRAELRGSGVSVCALCPGPVNTEFTDVAYRNRHNPDRSSPEFAHVSAEKVARVGLAAIEHDRALVVPGLIMKLAMFFVRITPMAILRIASRVSARRA